MVPYFKGHAQDIQSMCALKPDQPVCICKPISVERWVYRDPIARKVLIPFSPSKREHFL